MSRSIEKTSIIVEKVIAQARNLFQKYGYKKTTVDDIAHGCNISKKTLYEIFSSKEEIIIEVLYHETKEILKRYYNTVPSDSPYETRLLLFCRFIFSDMVERRENGHFWSLFIEDDIINQTALNSLKRIIKDIYEEGCKIGVFKPIDSVVASEVVTSIIITTFNNFHLREDPYCIFNEALSMIADSISYNKRVKFEGFKKDYYKILGVSRNASQDEIKKAYRKMAMKYHPDLTNKDEKLKKKFIGSQEAYEILKDPIKKSAYDNFLKQPFACDSDSFSWDFHMNYENMK